MKLAVLINLIVMLVFPLFVNAQMGMKFRGSDGWGIQSQYERFFNNYSLSRYYGKITEIDTITPMQDMGSGIQLKLKGDREEYIVHLGPAWFIIHQDMSLGINETVEIKGCKVAINGKPVIMAAELRRKDNILYLRDQDGIPYWSMWRKK
ncbi:MAG: DNA-binding protein [Fibrobacter sp.]|nr:DNA-binding protein [Fibrobacter sp.]